MMAFVLIAVFVAGYLCVAFEQRLQVDKAAIALLMFGVIWSLYACCGGTDVGQQLLTHLGSACETLVFLIGAMTIVEIIDSHGGFSFITERITTRRKHRLLWVLAIITFCLSAVLDNMTTAIVLIMMLRRIVSSGTERLLYASVVVIAANCGGAWSPIGDVSTIMLWMRGNVTTLRLILFLFVPCAVSLLVPVCLLSRRIHRNEMFAATGSDAIALPEGVGRRFSRVVLVLGIGGLLFVPLFKSFTGLPPYVGIMVSLGVLWVLTEWFYDRKSYVPEEHKNRVSRLLRRIDMPTILFLLGILMSVGGLQSAGILTAAARVLDSSVHEVFAIAGVVGLLSSVIDNVSLVAACMGMYPVVDVPALAASADPAYMQSFVQDGIFWLLLAYCAGVGGSMLIIGSAAGVVTMGLEKIDLGWYLRHITPAMLLGYLAGFALIYVEWLLFF